MLAGQSIKTLESVLDLAVWLEKHGQDFYELAMDETEDAELAALFALLMNEEKKHCSLYTRLRDEQFGGKKSAQPLFGEYSHFIDLLVREITRNLLIETNTTPKELLWKALLFEKDTLLYFNEIKTLFSGENVRIIDTICQEEKKHIMQLMERCKEMKLFFAS